MFLVCFWCNSNPSLFQFGFYYLINEAVFDWHETETGFSLVCLVYAFD